MSLRYISHNLRTRQQRSLLYFRGKVSIPIEFTHAYSIGESTQEDLGAENLNTTESPKLLN